MIVRYSFASFASAYFFRRAAETDGIRGFALGMCYVFTFGVALVLGVRIFAIILFYETRDLHVQTHKAVKIILLITSTLITVALWYGINDLVTFLAKSSTVPK
jgi:hypothetical protein